MDALEERLRERFEAGLVTDVAPPDFATRLTILRKRVLQDGLANVDDRRRSELIARRVDANIRALEGALIRVVAFGSLTAGRSTPSSPTRCSTGSTPTSRPRTRSPCDEIQERDLRGVRRLASTSSLSPAARRRSPGRARWRCTSRAS